jgi:hypothetical protein
LAHFDEAEKIVFKGYVNVLMVYAPANWPKDMLEALVIVLVLRYVDLKLSLSGGNCCKMNKLTDAMEAVEGVSVDMLNNWNAKLQKSFLHVNGAFMQKDDTSGNYSVSVSCMAEFMDKSMSTHTEVLKEVYEARSELRGIREVVIQQGAHVTALSNQLNVLNNSIKVLQYCFAYTLLIF